MFRGFSKFPEWLSERADMRAVQRVERYIRVLAKHGEMRRRETDRPLARIGVWSTEQHRMNALAAARARHPTTAPARDDPGNSSKA